MSTDRTLPRLILIGDGFTDEADSEAIVEAVRGGVRWVHLRDHHVRTNGVELAAPSLIARIREVAVDAAVSFNGRLETARHLALHYHARTHPDAVAEARRRLEPSAIIGFSAHGVDEAAAAVDAGADYVLFSPIYPTASKPDADPVGLDALRACAEHLGRTPVFALGGITPDNARDCLDAGAYGIAVLSGILQAEDVESAAAAYVGALRA